MDRVKGKVAFITGAARGQGRSHAVRLAEEGADIVAVDICTDVETVPYAGARSEDLALTKKLVEDLGGRIIARQADVRDFSALQKVVDEAVSEFGHIDIVCANAGIGTFAPAWELSEDEWDTLVDVNLTGVWKTLKAAIPQMIECNAGGAIVITSSSAGLAGMRNISHYAAAKHGVVGLARTLAVELAPFSIRVNTVHPGAVHTPMIDNPEVRTLFVPDIENPTREDVLPVFKSLNALPIPWVEPVDISNAVLWLASDEARYVTGIQLPVDCGSLMPYKIPQT